MAAAATVLKDAIEAAVVSELHHSTTSPYNLYLGGAKGISIYAPLGQDHCLRGLYTAQHSKLARNTHWDEFLAAYWGWADPPPFSPECVGTNQYSLHLPVVLRSFQ